jgi:hypothetical protein
VLPVLRFITLKLFKLFGPSTSFLLELEDDPNDPEDNSLLLSVITCLQSEEALGLFEKFLNNYWLNQPYKQRKLIHVTFTTNYRCN